VVLSADGSAYELVFVDDGSTDGSAQRLAELAEEDGHVRVVQLARSFGHQAAVSAGLDYAVGRGVIVMDADLQDPPEVLPQYIKEWRAGYEVVYAVRENRKEGWLQDKAYRLFYRLLRRVADIDIPLDAGDFCIMDRRVVDLLCAMPERTRFVRGIRSWIGFRQKGLPYERQARGAGKSKYTFRRLVLLAMNGFVSFSHTPLRAASVLGLLISAVAFFLALFYTVKKIVVGLHPPGFATLITAILFMAGVNLITLGVMGEYVGRIFDEVKRRPLYVVGRVLGRATSPAANLPKP
jgi:dolichol-phosphate mannosyltransferase